MHYTINDLRQDFPDEETCLNWIIKWRHPNGITCSKCDKITKHYKLRNRKAYSCGVCGKHFYPTADTIFHKSSTSLPLWFYAMYLLTNGKTGIASTQVARQIGVTYKTAWRMMHQLRKLMIDEPSKLTGEVEVDETYVHANVFKRSSARKKYGLTGARKGQIIFGMVERNGHVKLRHVIVAGKRVIQPHIDKEIAKGTIIYSDEARIYHDLHKRGYRHFTTNHSRHEYVNGNNYTQNIENVWSHLKRGIKGVYRSISAQHLQKYADEFAFRYSHRNHWSIFWVLTKKIATFYLIP